MSGDIATSSRWWVTEINQERPVEMGPAPFANTTPVTVMQRFRETLVHSKHRSAMSVKRNGKWQTWTYQMFYEDVLQFARSLLHFGFKPFDCVSILGANSPEWFVAAVGSIAAGGISTGIYNTNGADACSYIITHSKSVVVLVDDDIQLQKILSVRSQMPNVKAVVQWTGKVPPGISGVYTWADFMSFGKTVPMSQVEQRIADTKPTQVSTLIYTSGTTGPPKAVMLSHDNNTWTAANTAKRLGLVSTDTMISYLPLSHIAAQQSDIYVPLSVGIHVYFAQPDALRGSLGETLKEVRPTLFLGVPRVWEKIVDKIKEAAAQNGPTKQKIGAWARDIGLRGGLAITNGQSVPWGWFLANRLIFSKVKVALGLDRARLLGTSAAPITIDTLHFLLSLGLGVADIYGMSETTGPEGMNTETEVRVGSGGRKFPGTDLVIMNPDRDGNGEICWKGRNVFMGYLHNPTATSETIDQNGYLHSGDIGKIDKDGYLYITGRIKELIITAGGENIPPILIEDDLKREIGPLINNAMVIGDKRKFLTVLFTMKASPISVLVEGVYPFSEQLHPEALAVLEKIGSTAKTVQEAKTCPKIHDYLQKCVSAVNKRATSQAQYIRKFAIADQDFAMENEMLTPTMKLKRRVVLQKFSEDIEKMYAEPTTHVNAKL